MCTFTSHANVSLAFASTDRMLLNIKMVKSSVVKKTQVGHRRVNALLDVPIMIPGRADGLSESEETEGTAEIESNGCQSGTGGHTCMDQRR